MIDFVIVSENSLEKLNETIQRKSLEGYIPVGGLQIAPGPLSGTQYILSLEKKNKYSDEKHTSDSDNKVSDSEEIRKKIRYMQSSITRLQNECKELKNDLLKLKSDREKTKKSTTIKSSRPNKKSGMVVTNDQIQ